MKRAVMVLALTIILASAALGETLGNDEFSFAYPDGWTLDTVSYLSDNSEEYEWLGDFYNDVYWGSSFIETDTAFSGFSLKGAGDEERDEWVAARLELLAGYDAEIYSDAVSDSGVPFIFYTLTNEGNRLLEAATCVMGRDFVIDLCMFDGSEPDSGCYDLLAEMVKSFAAEGASPEGEAFEEDSDPADPEETPDPRKYSVAV